MKVSPEVKQLAAETAAKLGVATLYVNDKNEFFTEENLARGSVDLSLIHIQMCIRDRYTTAMQHWQK